MQDNQDRAPLGFAFEGKDKLTSTGKTLQRGAINESRAKKTTEVQTHIEPRGLGTSRFPTVSHETSQLQTSSKITELDNQIRNHI